MDGFSLDMAGGDLLDSSNFLFFEENDAMTPSAASNNNIPLSLGTPTGVTSLHADLFSTAMTPTTSSHFSHLQPPNNSNHPKSLMKNESETKKKKASGSTSGSKKQAAFSDDLFASSASIPSSSSSSSNLENQPHASSSSSSTSAPTNYIASHSSGRPHISSMGISQPVVSSPMMENPATGTSVSTSNPLYAASSSQPRVSYAQANTTTTLPAQHHHQAAMRSIQNQYHTDMASIRQLMVMQPDLIPPPLFVLHAGQQYNMMAAKLGGSQQQQQLFMQQQQQMQYMMQQQQPGTKMTGAPVVGAPGMLYNSQQQQQMATGGLGQVPDATEAARQQQIRQQMQQLQQMGSSTSIAQVPTWQSESDIPLRRKMIAKM